MPSVLFVFTSANKTLTGAQTGWYLPEAAHPYYILVPYAKIDFASPAGPNPPIDDYSLRSYSKDEECVKFLNDATVNAKFANAKKLSDVSVKDYDAIFYVGGHGPVLDLASDPVNAKLVAEFWKEGKVVSAVCHGPAALAQVVDASGKSIFAGRKATAFSTAEEEQIEKVKDIPFLPEEKIVSLGGKYEKADEPWGPKVVVDGQLITGQNPESAIGVGQALLKALNVTQ